MSKTHKETPEELEIQKSNPSDKADVKINQIAYSVKCLGFSNPAIVNHTNRDGWLKIAERKEFNIEWRVDRRLVRR